MVCYCDLSGLAPQTRCLCCLDRAFLADVLLVLFGKWPTTGPFLQPFRYCLQGKLLCKKVCLRFFAGWQTRLSLQTFCLNPHCALVVPFQADGAEPRRK